MDYGGRFTVRLPYDADYPRKLRMLRQSLDSGAIGIDECVRILAEVSGMKKK